MDDEERRKESLIKGQESFVKGQIPEGSYISTMNGAKNIDMSTLKATGLLGQLMSLAKPFTWWKPSLIMLLVPHCRCCPEWNPPPGALARDERQPTADRSARRSRMLKSRLSMMYQRPSKMPSIIRISQEPLLANMKQCRITLDILSII